MRTQLICRLHSDLVTLTWASYSPAADLVDWGSCPIAEFNSTQTVTFLVPSISILLTEVTLPTRQRQRQLQAVPYALEESLAADVDTLHFALAPSQGQTVAVAVVTHALMQAWQAALPEGNKRALVPEVLAVPLAEASWSIMLETEYALVRNGPYSGFAIELAQLTLALQLALTEQAPPERLQVFCHSTQADSDLITQLHGLGLPLQLTTQARTVAAIWGQGLATVPPINLLQGSYRPLSNYHNTWRPWRLTAILLVVSLLVYSLMQWLDYQQQQRYRTMLEQQIETVYRETFPEAQRIVSPRIQMEQRLRALQMPNSPQASATDFLRGLSQISPLLQQTQGLVLMRVEFRDNQFVFNLQLASLQALEHLQQRLQQTGLQVELLSASSRNDRVESRLRISL